MGGRKEKLHGLGRQETESDVSLRCPLASVTTSLRPLCRLFIDGDRIDEPSVKQHLLLDLGLEAEYRIQVLPYKAVLSELKTLCAGLSPREKVWVSDKASYAVSEAIPKVGEPHSGLLRAPWQPHRVMPPRLGCWLWGWRGL